MSEPRQTRDRWSVALDKRDVIGGAGLFWLTLRLADQSWV